MVVGHTPQRAGINSAADGQVWRVDTGMTAMIGGRPEVSMHAHEQTTNTVENAFPLVVGEGTQRCHRFVTTLALFDISIGSQGACMLLLDALHD